MFKSYIWSYPTRIFHWSFAILILICFLTDDEDLITIHAIAGYLLLIPFGFRVGWGFIGPKYSKFKDFPLGLKKLKEFILNIFDKNNYHAGHNPAASYVMIFMIMIIPLIILTGALAYGEEEAKGVFSNFYDFDFFEDVHEVFGNLMLLLIFAHLAGIISDKLLHPKTGTLNSIFKGYKNTETQEVIKLNIFQKIYALLFLIAFIIFSYYLIFDSSNPFIN